jgi:hypothetical protein
LKKITVDQKSLVNTKKTIKAIIMAEKEKKQKTKKPRAKKSKKK